MPPIDADVTGRELDDDVREELGGLASASAGTVARHLVMAVRHIDDDPERAYLHAQEARRMGGRIAVVREAAGQAAYAAGHYAEALSELRAARRINGSVTYLPIMADCERGRGRPDKALELAQSDEVQQLDTAGRTEMLIVAAGAHRDLGDLDAALRTLQVQGLNSRRRTGWVARLRYAYADLLLEAGREAEAVEWFTRSADADTEGVTDADDRLAELAGMTVVVDEDSPLESDLEPLNVDDADEDNAQ